MLLVMAEVFLLAELFCIVSAFGVVNGERAGGDGVAFVNGSGVSSGGNAAGGDNLCGGWSSLRRMCRCWGFPPHKTLLNYLNSLRGGCDSRSSCRFQKHHGESTHSIDH